MSYSDILDLYDEEFHLFVEKCFGLLSKQIGMGAVGYDFRDEEQKRLDDWFNSSSDEK